MLVPKITDFDLAGKRILLREDFNVSLKNGNIISDRRIRAALPTIEYILKNRGFIMILSHLGRPEEGLYDQAFSLAPIAERLSLLLNREVPLVQDWLNGIEGMKHHPILLLENVRFNVGETANHAGLAKRIAQLGDIFVMDAFATAHRAEASTIGVIKYIPQACAGPLLLSELETLQKIIMKPAHPVVAIVGGAKVSTKLGLLNALVKKIDYLIVGGGIANTFIVSEGYTVGRSLYEADLIDEAERLSIEVKQRKAEILIPQDVIVAERFIERSDHHTRLISQISDNEKIFDIGPDTIQRIIQVIKKAKTILWNGPIGAFEMDAFAAGTKALTQAIAESHAFKVAGGGDTLAAIEKYHIEDKINYISTGGGAFLTVLDDKQLPVVAALEEYMLKSCEH